MIDFIGQVIASWPFWVVVTLSILVWIFVYFIDLIPWWPQKKEWWQDREQRLAAKASKAKLNKARKG